jgi:hypothetical protein
VPILRRDSATMKLTMTHTFDASPAECWAMFHDPASHVAKFEGMGHHDVTVLEEERTDDALHIVITREVDVDGIPGFAKKFIKPRNTVVSDDRWEDRGDGTYGGQFTLDTKGVPMDILGRTSLSADGDGSHYEVTVELKVNVPLIGGKLEGFGKGIVESQLNKEFELGDRWLAAH